MWYRVRNCFNATNIITGSTGAGLAMIGIFVPLGWPNFSATTARTLTLIGILLVVIGLVLAIYKYLKNPVEAKIKAYSVITTLSRLHTRLETLANNEAQEKVGLGELNDAGTMISEFVGIAVPTVTTPDEAKSEVASAEKLLPSLFPKNRKRTEKIRWVLSISRLLDRNNLGLKDRRNTDKKYRRLQAELERYFDENKNIIDKKLRELIVSSRDFSEAAANALLFVRRTDATLSMTQKLGIPNILTSSLEADIEGFPTDMREIARTIRVDIGQYIAKLSAKQGEGKK